MFRLKKLSGASIEAAIHRAEHYRLLNEARAAESICLDVLEIDPRNQRALILLLLARTDQFAKGRGARVDQARDLLPRLDGEYERCYYAGIICERWAKTLLARSNPGSGEMVYDWLREAMEWYDKAEKLEPADNEDAVLRFNACVRLIRQHDHVEPNSAEEFQPLLE